MQSFISLRRLILMSALLVAAGCSDDGQEANCYPLDPMLDYEWPSLPLCDYHASEIPEPPPGYAHRYRVGVIFVPTEENPCEPCDRDHFDALLKSQIKEDLVAECDEPFADFQGLCYAPPSDPESATEKFCRVFGMYASNCEQREG
jgi:hypothetical protein